MKQKFNIDVSVIATSLISKALWVWLVTALSAISALILNAINASSETFAFLSVTNVLLFVCCVCSLVSLVMSFILLRKLQSNEGETSQTKTSRQLTQEEWMVFRANSINAELIFSSRTVLTCKTTYDLEVVGTSASKYPVNMMWTGTSYDGTTLQSSDTSCQLIETKRRIPPYDYQIEFDPEKKAGDSICFTTTTVVKDGDKEMLPMFSWSPKYPVKKLKLNVIAPSGLLKKVRKGMYVTTNNTTPVESPVSIPVDVVGNLERYTYEVDNPSFYYYGIEWEFT